MRHLARLVVLAPLVFALGGCITSETLVKLKADGSGTLEQTVLINKQTFEMIPKMMGDMMGGEVTSSSSPTPSSPLDNFDEAKLRAGAEKFGKGVRFVSVEKLTRGALEGALIVYEFDDVNALTVDADPPGPGGGPAAEPKEASKVEFSISQLAGGRSRVTVVFDDAPTEGDDASGAAAAPGADDMPPGMQAMMAQFFDGFRVSVDVEVDGTIVETSSPFVQGSRVTVLELDLGLLMKDPANLKTLEKLGPGASVSEMIPLLKDIPGIKVNQSPLTIDFSGR